MDLKIKKVAIPYRVSAKTKLHMKTFKGGCDYLFNKLQQNVKQKHQSRLLMFLKIKE